MRIPLLSPAFRSGWRASRTSDGQTTATVEGTLEAHRPTTDRIVIPATWDGPNLRVDPTGFTIGQVGADILADSVVAETDVASAQTRVSFERELDLLDTQRHTVTLSAEAFCRFSEYFTERKVLNVTSKVETELDDRGFDPLSVQIVAVASGDTIPVENFELDPVAGTITPLAGNGSNTEIQVDYIPLPISRISAESRRGKTTSFIVPSSAPPPPPNVIRVLPAFARRVRETNSRITVDHDGRVVRVHLTAPWNVSGEGELLAVACETDGSQTQWGRDATVEGTGTRAQPRNTVFRKATRRVNNVDRTFDIAAHDVVYDADRDLITSDIQVNATFAYRPFVQLSLCRYQPESISGSHVSTTVVTDTVRLGAQRRITVSRGGDDRVRVQLVGSDNENQVTVRVEEADPSVSDADLKWQDSDIAVVLTRTGTRRNARHFGTIDLPAVTGRRIVIEDAEPVQRHTSSGLVDEFEVGYREVVEIPDTW